ncbi:SAWADEE domain [Arabidopsis thaliana x Arabidopsis arenosa]|uniref:SAWADEE domain n=1 Tax=Arabidopsis thaliana x Arabidopsis arenosa TaxID=1240361 RepID=A0A8T1Y3D8_9BRAS|nr:SAWADEE domain [Arabidopsis thaliana x Arabidopsis arenosa]
MHKSLISYQSGATSPTIFSGEFADDVEWCEGNWPELEFRSPEDEAWYAVEVSDICDALMISFNGFSYEHDEFYPADDFKNSDEILEFEERFRACSEQMQDVECPKVHEGTKVCATCPSVTGEVKFYDAIVVTVERMKHERDEEGNEICGCDFKLFWKQGPWANKVTIAKVGDICLRAEDNRMNPKVVSFLKEARRKLHGEPCNQGEETEWQKILEKVNSAIRNNFSVDG